ncbi:Uncharacterised protein [Streptococcus pneumoniae]|nr:Uncharacterised protein [Streptococcus pneumoniae]CIW05533.1 Uncharacterised protein [Streptococcus pneumoniae]CJG92277.1 Uncharacterised protein [Streptococcus pneumoniae]
MIVGASLFFGFSKQRFKESLIEGHLVFADKPAQALVLLRKVGSPKKVSFLTLHLYFLILKIDILKITGF